MQKVFVPADMNAAFAMQFNRRDLEGLLALYEDGAALQADDARPVSVGRAQLAEALKRLLSLPGTMTSTNRYCLVVDELALLRAEWVIEDDARVPVAVGSSAEVIRRQPSGEWRYVIDHAMGSAA